METKKAYVKYILSLLLFGTNGVVASRIALSSYEIVLTRSFLGAILLAAVFLLSRRRGRGESTVAEAEIGRETEPMIGRATGARARRSLLFVAVSGVTMGFSWILLYEAYATVGVSIATLIYYVGPVLVLALAPLVFRERLAAMRLVGFAAVLAGMYLVNMRELTAGGMSWGLLSAVLAAATYAVMVVFNKKATGITGLENSMWQLVFAFCTVAIFTFAKQGVMLEIDARSVPWILVLGANTGLGCYLYFSAMVRLPAQSVAICGYLEPVAAVGFAAVFLREQLAPLQVAGMVLIIGGAVFAERRG